MKSNALKNYDERVNSVEWTARHQPLQMKGAFEEYDRTDERDRHNLSEDRQQGRQGGQTDHTRRDRQGQDEKSRQQFGSRVERGETLAA